MRILATPNGFVLIFSTLEDLKGTVKHLSGQIEWIKDENRSPKVMKPPYLYAVYDDHVPRELVEILLQTIKENPIFVEKN